MREIPQVNIPHPDLLREAEQLASLHPNELVVIWGLDRICYYASPSVFALEGYMPEEMTSRHYADFVVPEDLAHLELARSDADLTDESTFTFTVKMKSGGKLRVRAHSWRRQHPDNGQVFFLSRITPLDRRGP